MLVLAVTCLASLARTPPRPLEELKDGRYLKYEYNDGDSFEVSYKRDGQRQRNIFRLYFVDAIEARDKSKDDQKKLAEQVQHFGVAEETRDELTGYGEQAKKRVSELLARPFTIYTAFAVAGGRAKDNRHYAMITTADGRDLAEILVQEGLAWVKGKTRKRPDGTSGKEYQQHLRDLEAEAARARKGAWSLTSDAGISKLQEHSP